MRDQKRQTPRPLKVSNRGDPFKGKKLREMQTKRGENKMLNYFIYDVKNRFKEQIQHRPAQSISVGSSSYIRKDQMRYGSVSGKSCSIGGEP